MAPTATRPAMDPVRRVLAGIDALGFCGAALGATACLLLSAMLIAEVVLTSFFSYSQPWTVEYGNYFLAFILFAGSGWSVRAGDHIRVAFFSKALSPRGAKLLEMAVTALAIAIAAFCAAGLIGLASRTFAAGSRSYYPMQTPLAYPQGVIAASFVLLTLGFSARLVRLAIGDPPEDSPGDQPLLGLE